MRTLYVIFFIGFVTLNLSAKKNQDSIREFIKTTKNDSLKTMAYTDLCNELLSKPHLVLEILSEMAVYCERINNEKYKALCLRKIGAVYSYLNFFDKALEYTYKAADLFEKTKDINGLSYCYNNIGNFYNYKGEFTKDVKFQARSIEYHLKSIALRDTLKDSIPLMNSYNNIGNSTMAYGDYDKALKYFNKSRAMFLVTKDLLKIEMINENLGTCYVRLAGIKKNPAYYKQALFYYTAVLKDYNGKNPSNGFANVLSNVGNIYCETGNMQLGINYMKQGLEMAKEFHNKSTIMDAAERLSKAYEKTGEYNKAIELIHLYIANKDSLINEKNSTDTEEKQAIYLSSQKDKKIEKLNTDREIQEAELTRQRVVIFSTVGGILLILILGLVLLSRYNLKKKANLQLTDAYGKIETKNRQITDSINYSKRIQNAILPPAAQLKEKLKNFFLFYSPKDIVSGDFYWFSDHDDKLFFIVADCTGHGVPGALMSMIGNTLLSEIINQKNITDPGEILGHLNNGVMRALHQQDKDILTQDDGMDISIACLDKKNPGVLKYAAANHSMFVRNKNEVIELKGDIYSIGGSMGRTDKQFACNEYKIEKDNYLVMSTDGYYDQFGGERDTKFLVTNFEEWIRKTDLEKADPSESLRNAFENWKGKRKQTDDILVAGFKIG